MLLYNTYLCILFNDDAQLCCYIIHISAFYLVTMPSYVVSNTVPVHIYDLLILLNDDAQLPMLLGQSADGEKFYYYYSSRFISFLQRRSFRTDWMSR
jgi:hypothetical protein